MNKSYVRIYLILILFSTIFTSCSRKENDSGNNPDNSTRMTYASDKFVMGADLSYVNQILDHGGIYKDSDRVNNPYALFRKYGSNVIRLRLFYDPRWTREVYGSAGTQMYNDFNDVKKAILSSKDAGLQVCLDFHYSDTWADPSKQEPPAAWSGLSLNALHDSIYNYTLKTLDRLEAYNAMPEFVQTGNEINPGFLLPQGDRWNKTTDFIYLLNSAIKGVRDASMSSSVKPKVIIHIAQPENVYAWFDGLAAKGLNDYDIIGFSYYYLWSVTALENISNYVSLFRTTFHKDVMVMETGYPWTTGDADSYADIINVNKLVKGYPATETGQYNYLHTLTQEIIDGGGKGIFTWEPAWITSSLKDSWGTGSSWDCNTLFDFSGNTLKGIRFMTDNYVFK